MKPCSLLEQLRERIRFMHYSLSTEHVYVRHGRFSCTGRLAAVKCCIRVNCVQPDVEPFFMLATQRKVSSSTNNWVALPVH